MINILKFFAKTHTPTGSFPIGSNNTSTTPKRGSRELLDSYNNSPWVRGVVGKVAHSIATTEWQLFAVKGKRDAKFRRHKQVQMANAKYRRKLLQDLKSNDELVQIEDHPMLDLLNGGNALINGLNNNKLSQIYLDLIGESFQMKERDAVGVPTALWPVPPTWVRELPKNFDDTFKVNMNTMMKNVPIQDMVFLKDPDPVTPYGRGSGVGKSLGDEIDADEFSAKYIKDFFFNSARPDIIVSADGLGKDEVRRVENDWNNQNQGLFRRFRTYFFNKKLDVQTLTQDLKSMKINELRKFERDIIMQVYGVPPEIMGVIENSNRATIESADFIYSRWVLVPRLELRRCQYQESLVPDFDERLILDYVSPVEQDKEHKLNVVKATPWAFEVDEIRSLAEFAEKEDEVGKIHMVPFNLNATNLDEINEPATIEEVKNLLLEKNSLLVHSKQFLTSTEINALVRAADVKRLTSAVDVNIREMVDQFGQDAIDQAESALTFNLQSESVQEFINTETANRFATKINKTTQNSLRTQLAESVASNETIVQLTARVSDVFDIAVGNRARMIARTESVRISNFAAVEGMKQGRIEGKQWLSSRDLVVRDSHQPSTGLDGQIVAINADFKSPITGATGPHPGSLGVASEDINCRCTVLAILNLDGKAMTEDQKKAFWKDFESRRNPFERQMSRDLRKAFKQQRQDVLNKLIELLGA